MKTIKLDTYEAQILADFENDQLEPVADQKKEIDRYAGYFEAMPRKNKRISIRVAEQDLVEIQKKAVASGIPYQTLLTAILHQYAKGAITLGV